jgi:hypothetical protein
MGEFQGVLLRLVHRKRTRHGRHKTYRTIRRTDELHDEPIDTAQTVGSVSGPPLAALCVADSLDHRNVCTDPNALVTVCGTATMGALQVVVVCLVLLLLLPLLLPLLCCFPDRDTGGMPKHASRTLRSKAPPVCGGAFVTWTGAALAAVAAAAAPAAEA